MNRTLIGLLAASSALMAGLLSHPNGFLPVLALLCGTLAAGLAAYLSASKPSYRRAVSSRTSSKKLLTTLPKKTLHLITVVVLVVFKWPNLQVATALALSGRGPSCVSARRVLVVDTSR